MHTRDQRDDGGGRSRRVRGPLVIDRPRHSGVSNYGFFDRLWIGIMDLAGVWWLIRRKKPTPTAGEVQ